MSAESESGDPGEVAAKEAAVGRRFGARAVAVFAIALVAAGLFAVVTLLVTAKSAPLLHLDRSTAQQLHTIAVRHHGFTHAMRTVSTVGSTIAWLIILSPVIVWLLTRQRPRLAIFVLVTAGGSMLLNNLIKIIVARARPALIDPVAVAAGKSFPSGHSQAALVGYGVLLVVFLPLVTRAWRGPLAVLAVVMVLLIGLSRIALGVHYLSDVIGAYLVGLVWLFGMVGAFRTWRAEAAARGRPAG
jgi:membrane-associated phospholipid phosphatase